MRVILFGTIIEVDPATYKQHVLARGALNPKIECSGPLYLSDYLDHIRDGFHKASNSGPLIERFGRYLGQSENRYNIYFDPREIYAFLEDS